MSIKNTNNKNKQLILTPQNIQEENQKFEKLKKVKFSNGQYTEIHTYFKPQRIQRLIQDFQEFLNVYQSKVGTIDNEDFYLFFMMHVVKHFSTVCPEFPEDINEKIEFMKNLAEHPCLFELKDKFSEKEVAKVWEAMFKQIEDYQKIVKQDKKLRRQFIDKINKLENADAIKQAFGLNNSVNDDVVSDG